MSRRRKTIISILFLLSLILITSGITISMFTYTKQGDTNNTIKAGHITFLYTENTGSGNGINITNAFPVSDTLGKAYSSDNQVFDFTVESDISGDTSIPYEVSLKKKDTSSLSEEYIKVYLTDITEIEEQVLLNVNRFSELPVSTIYEDEKQIYYDTVDANEDYLKKFRLRMWVADTTLDGKEVNQADISEKEFTVTVNVYSNNEVVKQTYSSVNVSAIDSNGNDLRATASTIVGEEREILLEKLQESGYISNIDEVDALIEVKSDEFNDIAETTFDVSNIAEEGDKVVILHFNETTDEWEYIGEDIVDVNGTVTGNFTSFSPVAFVVVKNDNYELIPKKIYTIVADANSNGIADVGDEIRIGRTKEYFYVISNDGTNINALAKYNLNVGGEYDGSNWTAYTNPTGIQDSTMLGWVKGQTIRKGTTAFSSDSQKGTNYSDYQGSIVEGYVNNYVTYLYTNNNGLNATGRLILKEEIENLVNDGASLSSVSIKDKADAKGYSWLYSTSFWSGSASHTGLVWFVRSDGDFRASSSYYYDNNLFGVRPVITIAS